MADQRELGQDLVPSKFHLAFALAIVKLKPPGKQLKDYILEIRHFIRKDMQTVSPERFFDSVAFWQNAYKDSEAEQTKLLNKIFEMEQRTESLGRKSGQTQNNLNVGLDSTKRKLAASSESLKDEAPPSKRAQQTELKARQYKVGEGNEDSEALENDNAPKLMRQIYNVQRTLRKKQNYKAITIEAVDLCKIARTEILEATIQLRSSEKRPKPHLSPKTRKRDFAGVVKAVELSFNLVHKALHRVIGCKDERGYKGQIIYHVVCLFESIMGELTQHCTAVSKQTGSTSTILQDSSKTNKIRTQKPRKAASRKPTLPSREKRMSMQNDVAQQLIDLLVTMALSLDFSRGVDEEVMEGFLFIAINRVGKILSLFVFENHKLPSEVCPDLRPPQGLLDMKEEAMTPQAVHLEARYLIVFLDRVLNHDVSDTETMRTEFVRKTKDRFQKTLMQAVFGTTDPLFHRGLTRPATPPALPSANRAPNRQNFSEWFAEELWRLVGWDVLNSITLTS